jgi:hypothetical protein
VRYFTNSSGHPDTYVRSLNPKEFRWKKSLSPEAEKFLPKFRRQKKFLPKFGRQQPKKTFEMSFFSRGLFHTSSKEMSEVGAQLFRQNVAKIAQNS